MALTNKQRAFVEHYLGDAQWNATEAARRAGYAYPNMAGPRLLVKDSIKQHINERLRAMGAATEALMARWLQRIEADISPFVDENGLNVEALKEAGYGFLIKGVRKTKDATTIELRDPDKAEERLARHLGMFVERRELSGVGGGKIQIETRRKIDFTKLSDDELVSFCALVRRLLEGSGERTGQA